MKHNTKSSYEKPLAECHYRCAECQYFDGGGFCRANGIAVPTSGYNNPKDRPVPFPLNCFWWYANNVFDKMSADKIDGYKETRIHDFVAGIMLSQMPFGTERNEFINHFFRPGGGRLIDFDKYPEARKIYNKIVTTEI